MGLFGPSAAEATRLEEEKKTRMEKIRQIKAQGPSAAARQALRDASQELRARGALVQMIACTEFSLVASVLTGPQPVIDTLDVLVAQIVAFSKGENRG